MDCKERADDILFYAAGALSPDEAEPLRQHLALGCPRCTGELAEAQATLSLLSFTLPPSSPAPHVRDRLLQRLDRHLPPEQTQQHAHHEPHPVARPAPLTLTPPWWMQLFIPSAIAAAVAAGFTIFYTLRLQTHPPTPVAMVSPEQERTIGILTAYAEEQTHQLDALRANGAAELTQWAAQPELKMIFLPGTDKQPAGARGRIFWDAGQGVWHFFAAGLKPAQTGKTYELWFVSADKKLPAGSFDPTPDGDASLVSRVPPDIDPTIAAVTDEPAKTPITAPTGSFQLMGKLP